MADNKLFDTNDLARRFGVSTRTIYRWRAMGVFPMPVCRPGQTLAWAEADLKRFEAQRQNVQDMQTDDVDTVVADIPDDSLFEDAPPEVIRREIRRQLRLPFDASEASVLGAVIELLGKAHTAQRKATALAHRSHREHTVIKETMKTLGKLIEPTAEETGVQCS